jgi:hypothetical protein
LSLYIHSFNTSSWSRSRNHHSTNSRQSWIGPCRENPRETLSEDHYKAVGSFVISKAAKVERLFSGWFFFKDCCNQFVPFQPQLSTYPNPPLGKRSAEKSPETNPSMKAKVIKRARNALSADGPGVNDDQDIEFENTQTGRHI